MGTKLFVRSLKCEAKVEKKEKKCNRPVICGGVHSL
ncbi:hypothetical protein AJ81_03295 [Pseudothermotoga hypogea DSM 11164 = NBRC 106472]|uniref:Uncharacterized protein n=1 Tax=Pseudothermotoga hypogea DSM 11164 = NBRC 106472 TaxID=1123384 RepID=A0A0X1KTU0_9THEM|nr:hypothetical protein AJ81_03295 [Pseudothermotoga hypogea DSM 11164 = NBRC 106472]